MIINKIIDGISSALYTEFGEDYEIYIEDIKQGLNEPCFSIVCLSPKSSQFLGKRYFKQNQFCIHYFPKDNEVLEVVERLYECLELITVDGDLCRGTGMSAEVVGDVVNFIVNYDMFIHKKEVIPEMETVDVDFTKVKG